MAYDESSLRALEGLLSEFFFVRTTNERKREIEQQLESFSQQRDAWHHCLFFMAHTSNEYVMMYCMTVLENLINRRWIGMEFQDKLEVRQTLNKFLLSHHKKVPTFIRNKLVKLVVDIGRVDWPHFYPDFLSSILQLVQQPDTVELGLVFIQTTSEELACPREDLSVTRKEELHRLLLAQVPTLLSLLTGTLDSILEKHLHLVTATPPPSPTHGESSETKSSHKLFSTSPLHPGSILSNMFKCPSNKVRVEALPPMDSHSHHVCVLCLNCLSHLFSWIPLSSTITSALLSTIFQFAALGCEPNQTQDSSSHFSCNANKDLGILAMGCVNELLSKNCVPQEFQDFLLQMFQQTFYLLQRLTKESSTNPAGNKLSEIDENYVEKFTEFLRLFVSIHLRRFESNTQFPMLEFLALLFKYTFKQPSLEGYFACLDIWTVFLDYLSTKLKNRAVDAHIVITKYTEALVSLVTQILHKLQFRYNQSQLDELDDETLDDDSETEWQHFLRTSVEVVAHIAEMIPGDVFNLLYVPFEEHIGIYLGLEQHIANNGQGNSLTITGETECRRLHCTLRDLSSLLQALGRMAEHFIGEHFADRFDNAKTVVTKLVKLADYGTRLKLYELNTAAQNVLQSGFVEAHAQSLAAVKAYAHWLSRFYIESRSHPEYREACAQYISTIIGSVVPLFRKEVPDKVVLSAAHLLLSVMTTVRPSYLLQLPKIQALYSSVTQGLCSHMSTEIQLLVYRSLSHYLLLPWPSVGEDEQQWDTRAGNHQIFIKELTSQYSQLNHSSAMVNNKTLQEQAKPCVKKTLHVLTDLVESVSGEIVKSKQICFSSLQDLVHVTLGLFPIYIHQPDVEDVILGFFLAMFQGLRVQMGVPFTEQTIQTFLSMFTREQLAETILHESSAGFRVIEKFLKILQLIVQEPGNAFKTFLPNIIAICMEQIYPIVAERSTPDIKLPLYELLYQLLTNNWRYFFKSAIFKTMQIGQGEVAHEQQFVAIMQSFGQSFLQSDIAIFRHNLEALESLNEKWKLYRKQIFINLMLNQFLSVLIQVLIHKSHDLLQEEIGISVYNMASVDFERFYQDFLSQFLMNCEGLDSNQKSLLAQNFKTDNDLPSFTQSIHRFVNDIRYYRLCNSSLPAGSVKL